MALGLVDFGGGVGGGVDADVVGGGGSPAGDCGGRSIGAGVVVARDVEDVVSASGGGEVRGTERGRNTSFGKRKRTIGMFPRH